jgi:ribosomal silencing factor RsfS
VNTISGLAGSSFIEANIDELNVDLSIFNIDNKTEIDNSIVIIEADSPEEAERIREHIQDE